MLKLYETVSLHKLSQTHTAAAAVTGIIRHLGAELAFCRPGSRA